MAYQAVMLDVDGTLILSNDAHAECWVRAFREHGYTIPFERVRPLLGMGGDQLIPRLVPGLTSKEGEGKRIADRRKQIFLEEYAGKLREAPGARALVERLRQAGMRLIVASSAKPDELEPLLRVARVDDLLPERTTSADAEHSKPAPDIVAVALEKLGVEAGRAVFLGDTPYDVESAGKIGVGTLALRCGGFSDADLSGALAIYDDPADLLARYEASPLGA